MSALTASRYQVCVNVSPKFWREPNPNAIFHIPSAFADYGRQFPWAAYGMNVGVTHKHLSRGNEMCFGQSDTEMLLVGVIPLLVPVCRLILIYRNAA
jgi:hypothetical protein